MADTPEQKWADVIDDLRATEQINDAQWNDLDAILAILADGHGKMTKKHETAMACAISAAVNKYDNEAVV